MGGLILLGSLSIRYQPDYQGPQQYAVELADETGYRIPAGKAVFRDPENGVFMVSLPRAAFGSGGALRPFPGADRWDLGILAEVFPRRGRSVLLRLLDPDTRALQCQFAVPNPARPGPFPEWKATPLPVMLHSGGLSVELLKLQSGVTPPTEAGNVDRLHEPWIRADLRVRERGNPTTRWEPAAFSLSDATGNQYEHTEPRSELRDGVLRCYSIQTLSSSEPVWKVRIRLRRANTTAHPAAAGRARFWTPAPLAIPPFATAWSKHQVGTAGGARITMTAETESRLGGDPAAVRITLAAEPPTWVPDLRILDPQNEFVRLPHARLTAEPGRAVWRIPVAAEGDTLKLQVRAAVEPEFEFLVRPQ